MLKIKIELWPHGDEQEAQVIAWADIWNNGTSEDRKIYGNYQAEIYEIDYDGEMQCMTKDLMRHQRSQSVWSLIRKMLKGIRYK